MFRRLANDRGAVAVGKDQPSIVGKYLERHVLGGRKKQPIAVQPVFWPFLIDTKIINRRLDFHDPDFAAVTECDEIGPPAGPEHEF